MQLFSAREQMSAMVDPTPKSGAGEADSVILTAGSLLLLGGARLHGKDEGGRQAAFRSPNARRGPSALPGQVLRGCGRSLGSTQPAGPRHPEWPCWARRPQRLTARVFSQHMGTDGSSSHPRKPNISLVTLLICSQGSSCK